MATPNTPLWEVFIRSRNGLAHKHVGSLHASDTTMALQAARDLYTRRGEGLSIWVVPSSAITASDPSEKGMMFEPAESKIYRHPTFYEVPDEVGHMCDAVATARRSKYRPHPEEPRIFAGRLEGWRHGRDSRPPFETRAQKGRAPQDEGGE
jgi:ring-1,2-phenylacetyl-CoA epoxidase subunit PaaB